MDNPQPNKPKRMQLSPRDLFLLAVAIFVLTRIDWHHLDSFHVLLLFLLFLMLMLRWTNMRKDAARKQTMERYKEQHEAEAIPTEAEEISPADMTVDGKAIPSEETSPTEEKPEE